MSQAVDDGGCDGHSQIAGANKNKLAPSWLPAATASGATPLRRRFVKLAEKP